MAIYIIKHIYDVDGGFGDAVETESTVGIVDCTEEEIKEFLDKYDKPIVYDEPYAYLTCHTLIAEEIKVETLVSIEKDPYGDNGVYEGWAASFEQRDPEGFERCQEGLREWLEVNNG